MQSESTTVACPNCGRPAQLQLFQHTDQQGHRLHHELSFTCGCAHRPDEQDLIAMWATGHATAHC
jgi:hypothetical protein